jgi:hypothetical protein
MRYTKELQNLMSSKKSTITFEEENVCPICKTNI